MSLSKTMDRTVTLGEYSFDEKEHLHKLGDKTLTGVTTVLKVIGKGDVLVNWAANCAVDYIDSNIEEIIEAYQEGIELGGNGSTAEEAEDGMYFWKNYNNLLKEARTAHTKKKEAAGDWGTNIHAMVENHINQAIKENEGYIPYIIGGTDASETNFLNWAVENKVKFLASEKHVYSKEWWVGGICDIICEIDGKRFIGDIKTSKGIYPEAFIQCSAYAKMLEEMPYRNIKDIPHFDGVVIINLKKDGGFDVQYNYDLEGSQKCFEAALTIYRHMEAITK